MTFKFWPKTKVMRFSLIAMILVLILSLLSMGFLGFGLLSLATPILFLLLPNIPNDLNSWQGDWFWPATIAMPMLWSIGFLFAGAIYLKLEKLDWTTLTLKASYIVILLIWNLFIWLVLFLNLSPKVT